MDSNHNLTPNVQTIFTAATNRRRHETPPFGLVTGGQPAVSG